MNKYGILVLALAVTTSTAVSFAAVGGMFPDVSADDWFAPAAKYVTEAGLMTGQANGNFDAAGLLNRAELATVLQRSSIEEIKTELAAIRQADASELSGASWEEYREKYYRFPYKGIPSIQGGLSQKEMLEALDPVATDRELKLYSANSTNLFIEVTPDVCADCSELYGPFVDDPGRLADEINTLLESL